MTADGRPRQEEEAAAPVRALLVVARDAADGEGLFRDLTARAGFRVEWAASVAEAAEALRARPVALLIAAPDVPTAAVTDLLASKERLRPELPVLVVRHRQAEEPASWARRGVGVLRCPLLPAALSGSVEVVLGLGRSER